MRSPAAAIAWQFRRRHRWGWIALTGYFVTLAAIRIAAAGQPIRFADELTFALLVVVPLTATFIYFLAVFSFGLDGDIAGRESMIPARMLTLPVTAGALAGWPMLYGAVSMVVLWSLTRVLGIWPPEFPIPRYWPALLAAVLLAWTQALTWMAYPLRGLRVIVTVLWLMTIDATVMIALQFRPREMVMLAILAPHLPFAYFAARFAVRRARCGDVPDWRAVLRPFASTRVESPKAKAAFESTARAQMWIEWRTHGWSLPVLVAILLPFELAMLFIFHQTPAIVTEMLALVLLTPPFMAAFVAATVGRTNRVGSDGIDSFLATRPMTTMALVAAKLKATLLSTLVTWLLVAVATPVAVVISGTSETALEMARTFAAILGTRRGIALAIVCGLLLVSSTWKQLVQSLYARLSGREWLAKASVFAVLSILAIALPAIHWISESRGAIAFLWIEAPTILAALVVLKMVAAGWVVNRMHECRLLSGRPLLALAVWWDLAVVALYAAFVWIVPEVLIRHYVLALTAILVVPLVRLTAAPVALAGNRHR